MTRLCSSQYAALLRGINVNGINIKMADLKAAFEALGLQNVRTVLASGNVLFETEDGAPTLTHRIESALTGVFGYEAHVLLLDLATLGQIARAYPFARSQDGWHDYVVFCFDDATRDELLSIQGKLNPELERIQGGDSALYWRVRKGMTTDSAFGKLSGKARFRATTTTRNLNTLEKLLV